MTEFILETSWDAGDGLDLKLAELLDKYHIPATFYIQNNSNIHEGNILELAEKFNIGGHTVSHPPDMKLLSYDEQFNEIKDNLDYLERIIGKKISTFAYPRGRYDDITIEILKELEIKEGRTTIVGQITLPDDPYRKHTTVHAFQRKEYKGENWLDYGIKKLNEVAKNGGYFHLWGHSYEVDRYDLWDELEILLKEISRYI